jgi:hypothetical protein
MMNLKYYLIGLLALLTLPNCQNDHTTTSNTENQNDTPQFTLLPAAETGVDFVNSFIETPKRNLGNYDYFFNGSGVAVGDFNNDGLSDLYFCGNDADNKMYLNKGNWKFEDVTQKAGVASKGKWSTGVTLVDINNDGWLDIYVCNSGPYTKAESLTNELYVNNQDGTFSEQAAQYGINDVARTTQASFFDMDKDGDLDLFVMNHALRNRDGIANTWHQTFNQLPEEKRNQEINTLFRNEGNGRFTNISKEAGIDKVGFGLGLAISDFDENGYPDIYVANDYFVPDFLFMNNGDGTFTDKIKQKASHISYYAMGCDAADVNNDGLIDLATVDMTPSDHFRNKTLMASMNVPQFTFLREAMGFSPQYMFNSLQINRGFGVFSETGLMSGVAQTDWSWAALLADFDNDGYKDLLVTNGYYRDTKDNDWRLQLPEVYKQKGKSQEVYFEHLKNAKQVPIPNYIYRNNGDLSFSDNTQKWNFNEPSFSQGAAYADLDQDGDLDLVINNLDKPAFIYKNNAVENGSNYIRFQLSSKTIPALCTNAKVEIHYGDEMQVVENHHTRGYQSFVEPIVHFGLGAITAVDKAIIHWPDGQVTEIAQPAVNKVHNIEMTAQNRAAKPSDKAAAPFRDITRQQVNIKFRHKENKYNDFATEVLLPHQQSKLGPALATADVNGDGLDDFYIGGAKGQAGKLYTQTPSMIFEEGNSGIFAADAEQEDLGAIFFDADQDGDQDLYVASGGGGEFREGSNLLQDRLYINDGRGNFTKSNSLPKVNASTKAIAAADWDKDGDLDLFVGGRTKPALYPQAPQSYLLRNDGGKFIDVTADMMPSLTRIGMITDAIWVDVDQNGWLDLMLVGEWMPITILKNDDGQLTDITENNVLANYKGWWYQIEAADFDQDGDQDFIVGNIGLNNKFHPSDEKNLHVYSNDFDDNGTLDIVLSKYYKGRKVPVRGKECSTDQMPFLEEKFKSYASFASSSMEEIYGAAKLEEALHYSVNNFASIYIENEGDFKFNIKELPVEAQIAPINSIVIHDFDNDGQLDVVVGGNMFETEVETPAYDAGKGLFMKGLGGGQFEASFRMPDSGLFIHHNVKGISMLRLGADRFPGLVVANNDALVQMYVWMQQN